MKKSKKAFIALSLALGLLSVNHAVDAFYYKSCSWIPGYYTANGWHPGHRECRANYGYGYGGYSVDRCGWVPGHYAPYGYVPGHRACWW